MLLLFHLSGYAARMQEATMTKTPLEDFLNECVAADPGGDGAGSKGLRPWVAGRSEPVYAQPMSASNTVDDGARI